MGIDSEFLNILTDKAGENRVYTGGDINPSYGKDEAAFAEPSMPDAVVEANSAGMVSDVLKLCRSYRVPVTVRGAGTGKAGGCVAAEGGVLLSLRDMNAILGVDEAARTMRVQPGALLQDVKAEAERHGLRYPPDPGEKTATIGGNASTNASGPCALKYGATRDYVLDAEIVLAGGNTVRLSERPEYAEVIGSEGTLGVITELTLRLTDKPGCEAILLLPFAGAEECVSAAAAILAAGFEPAALEFLDTALVEYSGSVTGSAVFPVSLDGERVAATLMLTLEGADEDAVMEQMEALAERAEELGCLDILVGDTPNMMRDFRAAYDAFHTSVESAASSCEANVSLPPEEVWTYMEYARAEGAKRGITPMFCAHLGSGGVHTFAVSDKPRSEFAPAAGEYMSALYEKCASLGGDPAGEYGVGRVKGAYLSAERRAARAALKAELDPEGILNPGKAAE